MQKILLVGLLLISTLAFSQVEKGDFSGTANIAFINQKFKDFDDPLNITSITVRGGYYFTDNIEAGLTLSLSGVTALGETNTNVGIGPYAVYNFLTEDGKLLPYVGANFVSQSQTDQDALNQIGAFGGLKYFLTEVVNVDTSVNYTSWLGDIKGSTLFINVGVGINFGKLK